MFMQSKIYTYIGIYSQSSISSRGHFLAFSYLFYKNIFPPNNLEVHAKYLNRDFLNCTVTHRLTTGIPSKKCTVRRFHHCVIITELLTQI